MKRKSMKMKAKCRQWRNGETKKSVIRLAMAKMASRRRNENPRRNGIIRHAMAAQPAMQYGVMQCEAAQLVNGEENQAKIMAKINYRRGSGISARLAAKRRSSKSWQQSSAKMKICGASWRK
jgi:hypothetical protein